MSDDIFLPPVDVSFLASGITLVPPECFLPIFFLAMRKLPFAFQLSEAHAGIAVAPLQELVRCS